MKLNRAGRQPPREAQDSPPLRKGPRSGGVCYCSPLLRTVKAGFNYGIRPTTDHKDPLQSPVHFTAGASFPQGKPKTEPPHQSPVHFVAGSSLASGTPCMKVNRAGRQPPREAQYTPPSREGLRIRGECYCSPLLQTVKSRIQPRKNTRGRLRNPVYEKIASCREQACLFRIFVVKAGLDLTKGERFVLLRTHVTASTPTYQLSVRNCLHK